MKESWKHGVEERMRERKSVADVGERERVVGARERNRSEDIVNNKETRSEMICL